MGDAGFPIIGYDVNGDGKLDLIYGRGHSYGLYWLEEQNRRRRASPAWTKQHHRRGAIRRFMLSSSSISMATASQELITGSATAVTAATIPASYDPLVVYYYKIDRLRNRHLHAAIPSASKRNRRRRHAIYRRGYGRRR